MSQKILIIATSHNVLGDTGKPTGSWLEEVAAPFLVWTNAGYAITVASVLGGEVPMDPGSLDTPFLTPEAESFLKSDAAAALKTTPKFTDLSIDDYDAVFLPGGHGVCFDLATNHDLAALLSKAYISGKVVSAVCHGPVGLIGAKDANGVSIIKNRKVTGFSNTEEHAVGKQDTIPFLLEDKLKELGGLYTKAADWQPHVVRDGNLITGQNPASSAKVAELVVEAISSKK